MKLSTRGFHVRIAKDGEAVITNRVRYGWQADEATGLPDAD